MSKLNLLFGPRLSIAPPPEPPTVVVNSTVEFAAALGAQV